MALTLWHSGCFRPRHCRNEALRGRRRLFAGMLALVGLAGCTVGPDFKLPEPPPVAGYLPGGDRQPGRIFVAGGDIPARWWEVFRSRHLNELIQSGIAHNADLKAAEAAVRVAQANTLAQSGALFPQVAANWNSSGQQTPTAALQTNAANMPAPTRCTRPRSPLPMRSMRGAARAVKSNRSKRRPKRQRFSARRSI